MSVTTPLADRSEVVAHLLVDEETAEGLRQSSLAFSSLTLTKRQLCDLELLINGGFSPLRGFMDQSTYDGVVADCRLPDGSLWPMPVVLDVDAAFAEKLEPGSKVALRDAEGFMPAVLTVTQIWEADKEREAELVYGTSSSEHPGVAYLFDRVKTHYVGAPWRAYSFRPTTSSRISGIPRRSCATCFARWAGGGSSPFTPRMSSTSSIDV